MKRLNRKGYLTIEIILGATIAFAIAFFLMEITAKMVSDTEDTYRDTTVATDSALIISGVKDQIENRVNDEEGVLLKITSISCNNNVCTIKYNDNNDGELFIDGSKVVFKVNNVVQYSKQLDDSLTDIKLTSSFNSEINDDNKSNVYFKVTGKNIFLGKDYSIIIPIDNMEIVEPEKPKEPDFEDPNDPTPPSEPEDPNSLVINCPTKNPTEGNLPSLYTDADVNKEPWTNTYGTGKVSITVTATGGKIVKVYYFNYSTYQDNYVNSPIVLKNDQDAPTDASATFKVTDAKTNTIKVFAVDTNNNTVSKECVTNVDTIVPYTPTIHLMKDTTGYYANLNSYGKPIYIYPTENTCCVVTLGIGERVCENITTTDTRDTECYIKYSTSRGGFRGWCDDKTSNTKRDGLSEWYSYKWAYYKNNAYVGTCNGVLSKSLTDTVWINTGTGCSGNVSYDKMEFTATDAAGNVSPKLTYYSK